MNKSDFDYLLKILKGNAGWDFSEEEYFILDKKITNFVREKGYAAVEELIDEVRIGQKSFISQLIESLTLLGTSFYRDYSVFRQFEDNILPYLREYNRGVKKLRVWSAGCSTGQETYSIAISIKNKLLNVSDWDIDIIGTDISEQAIVKAKNGSYNQFEIQMGMNARKIIDNFHYEKDSWLVNDDIASMVSFKKNNLLDDFSLSKKFDVIFCRYVLSMFTKEYQKKIARNMFNVQTPNGLFYVGKTEKIEGIEEFYSKVPGFDGLYQARSVDKVQKLTAPAKESDAATGKSEMPRFVRPEKLIKRPTISSLLRK